MFAECFENVRSTCPLIHNITNYVTVNDCANMVLACGASPIMADDAADTGHFHALAAEARHRQTFPLAAGQQLHIGVVLDLTDLRILL